MWYNGLTDSFIGALALFVVGVAFLIKGGDWFVDSAVSIAKKFRMPEIIIGATVVSIGTTLPALVRGKLRRSQGITLLAVYAVFVILQVLIAIKVV